MNLIVHRGKMIGAPEMIFGGIVAGVFSGVAMLAVLMLRAQETDMGLWYPPQMIASNFMGVQALVSGPVAVLMGLLIHFSISIFWGALYGVLWGRIQGGLKAAGSGLFFGLLVWSVTTFFILPLGGEIMLARVQLDPWWWLAAHLVFGLCFSILPYVEAALAPRADLKPQRARRRYLRGFTIGHRP